MNLDESTVNKIASLAKLEFNGEEKQAILNDMNKMLAFVSKLNEVDTEGVSPLIHITEETNVLRNDTARTDITQKEALKNAPKKDSTYFKIPKVLNK
ncbi:MAG: Asp-tRNA(Asn)/Glu-tRNA(Gln) amidotransferase subunit GatC [Flavobacteriales bacterium]|nr:Asp-tRNA(Asn)/Glu-tRNA(Gln) amidotransferase subunit GatC [Flavobacteriales bacterium]